MGTGPRAVATFDFFDGTEVIEFPEFHQGNLLTRGSPTFELVGVPGNTPLLHEIVDNARKASSKSTGVSTSDETFDVNVGMMYGDILSRGYDYTIVV